MDEDALFGYSLLDDENSTAADAGGRGQGKRRRLPKKKSTKFADSDESDGGSDAAEHLPATQRSASLSEPPPAQRASRAKAVRTRMNTLAKMKY